MFVSRLHEPDRAAPLHVHRNCRSKTRVAIEGRWAPDLRILQAVRQVLFAGPIVEHPGLQLALVWRGNTTHRLLQPATHIFGDMDAFFPAPAEHPLKNGAKRRFETAECLKVNEAEPLQL